MNTDRGRVYEVFRTLYHNEVFQLINDTLDYRTIIGSGGLTMKIVTITEAEENLEEYIELLETGQEDIINIMIDGKEVAQLVSFPKRINSDIAEQTVKQSIEQGYLPDFLTENIKQAGLSDEAISDILTTADDVVVK